MSMETSRGHVPTLNPTSGSLVDQLVELGRMARLNGQGDYARSLIAEFAKSVVAEAKTVDPLLEIKQRIAEIDGVITKQLNHILHDEKVQKLEGSWRALHKFVNNADTGPDLKLRLFNVGKAELLTDFERAAEFDQTALFKKIYEEEYGTFGGSPYTIVVADFEFGRTAQDIALLEHLSNVSAASHAPTLTAAHPSLMDLDTWLDLPKPRDLTKIFDSAEMIRWRAFRDSEDSRYVVLTLPRVMERLPYDPATNPVEGLFFTEDVGVGEHAKYLWGNAAYELAGRITNAFTNYGWCAAMRGVEGGGLITGLPAHTYRTDDGETVLKCPTETPITDRREKELNDAGFIALLHQKGTDRAAFIGGHTANKPRVYDTSQANANAQLSAMLPYMLAASRFAHYLKVIMRDKIGSFTSRDDVQNYLNDWLSDYILLSDTASQEERASYPLREGRVDVVEVPGRPGAYRAAVFLRPHFQLEELNASIRLVAELPAPAA